MNRATFVLDFKVCVELLEKGSCMAPRAARCSSWANVLCRASPSVRPHHKAAVPSVPLGRGRGRLPARDRYGARATFPCPTDSS